MEIKIKEFDGNEITIETDTIVPLKYGISYYDESAENHTSFLKYDDFKEIVILS